MHESLVVTRFLFVWPKGPPANLAQKPLLAHQLLKFINDFMFIDKSEDRSETAPDNDEGTDVDD
jgi:hypothetical protein